MSEKWKPKEKEPTEARTNYEIRNLNDLIKILEHAVIIEKEDLEFLFGGSNYKSNEKYHALRKKYLEEDHE